MHEKVKDKFVKALINAYGTISIGDPLNTQNLMGPLHTKAAVKEFTEGIEEIKK